MPVTLRKAELEKLLAAERRKAKADAISKSDVKQSVKQAQKELALKHRKSAFTKRTLSIYTNQRNRMRKEYSKPDAHLPYTLEEFRAMVEPVIGTMCPYTEGVKLTLAKLAVDHKIPISRATEFNLNPKQVWSLNNLAVCSKEANLRKGLMTDKEFVKFDRGLRKNFPARVVSDIYRRLVTGGKWTSQQ